MKFRNDPMVRLYDRTQDWLQEKGQPYIRVLGGLLIATLIVTAGYYFFEYRQNKAAEDFGEAWAKYNAPVVDSDAPAQPQAGKTYTDERVKWQESAEAFDQVSVKHSGYYGVIGKYFAATSYLHFDPAKGVQMLEEVAGKNDQPTSDLARLALAEHYSANGDIEGALKLYEGLMSSTFVPQQAVQLGLGRTYEKSGDKQKAADAYFEAAKIDRITATGADAEKRLSALAPDRVKELPAKAQSPFE